MPSMGSIGFGELELGAQNTMKNTGSMLNIIAKF